MYSVFDIALWFLLKNNSEIKTHQAENDDYEVYEGISHLKLQKLLYYAQGVFLAINNKKLFNNNIEAWEHGPVVPEIYAEYKINGRNNIPIKELTKEQQKTIETIELDTETSNILNTVYNNFAIYTAWQLREMTHVPNGPWDITIKENKNGYQLELK